MESKLSFNFKTNQEILKLIGFIDSFKEDGNKSRAKNQDT